MLSNHLAATFTTRGARRPPIMAEKNAVMTMGKVKRDASSLRVITIIISTEVVDQPCFLRRDSQSQVLEVDQKGANRRSLNNRSGFHQTCQCLHIAARSRIVQIRRGSLHSTGFLDRDDRFEEKDDCGNLTTQPK